MNVTLRIAESLGKRAKHLAVDEGKSLSALVEELLAERLGCSEETYREAQARAWELMQEGVHGGGQPFERDCLYDRDERA
jgi:hypothetical protein